LPLELISGISSVTSTIGASCVLTIPSDPKPLEIVFAKPQDAFQAMMRPHVKARDAFIRALEERRHARPPCAAAATPSPPTEPRRETHAARKGRELLELLRRVSKLRSAHKMKEAAALFA
jgi:hypothetical protein